MRQVPGAVSAKAAFGGANLPVLPPGAPLPLPPSASPDATGQLAASAAWLEEGQEVDGLPGVEEGHIAQAFREIDFGGHGYIGVSELRYLLALHGERPEDDELDEMVRMVDRDGNGRIAFEDFLQLFVPGHVVHTEMTAMAPEEVAASSGGPKQRGPPRPTDKRTANLVMKSAAGFLYSDVRLKRDQDRRKALPQPKRDPMSPDTRCRPGGPSAAIPVNTRAARRGRGGPATAGEQGGRPAAYLPREDERLPRGPATPSGSPTGSRGATPVGGPGLQRRQSLTSMLGQMPDHG